MSQNQYELLKNKGNECFKLKKFQEAIKYYTEAIGEKDDEPIAYSNRAICHINLDNFFEAKRDCDRAIQLDSTLVKAYYRRATALKNLHRYQKAIDDFRQVAKLDPDFVLALREISAIERLLEDDKRIELPIINKPQSLQSQQPLVKFDLNNHYTGSMSYSNADL